MTPKLLILNIIVISMIINVLGQESEDKVNEILTVAELMPMYPGCHEDGFSLSQMDSCTRNNIAIYLSKYLNYPEEAKKMKRTGTAIVQFVVNKKGILDNLNIVKAKVTPQTNPSMPILMPFGPGWFQKLN